MISFELCREMQITYFCWSVGGAEIDVSAEIILFEPDPGYTGVGKRKHSNATLSFSPLAEWSCFTIPIPL